MSSTTGTARAIAAWASGLPFRLVNEGKGENHPPSALGKPDRLAEKALAASLLQKSFAQKCAAAHGK